MSNIIIIFLSFEPQKLPLWGVGGQIWPNTKTNQYLNGLYYNFIYKKRKSPKSST